MLPVLFKLFGLPINSYGLSKALAALSAAYLLGREFRRRGWNPDHAWTMVMGGTVFGFVGAKIYYLLENIHYLAPHLLGSSGFTWYGGLIAGVLSITVMARRYRIPLGEFAGMAAAPLSLAYGIGRIGASCPVTAPTANLRTFRGRWRSRTGRCRRWSGFIRPPSMRRSSLSSWPGCSGRFDPE